MRPRTQKVDLLHALTKLNHPCTSAHRPVRHRPPSQARSSIGLHLLLLHLSQQPDMHATFHGGIGIHMSVSLRPSHLVAILRPKLRPAYAEPCRSSTEFRIAFVGPMSASAPQGCSRRYKGIESGISSWFRSSGLSALLLGLPNIVTFDREQRTKQAIL